MVKRESSPAATVPLAVPVFFAAASPNPVTAMVCAPVDVLVETLMLAPLRKVCEATVAPFSEVMPLPPPLV